MDKNELYKMLLNKEKEVEANRNKRAIITILAFSLIYFLLFYFTEKPTGIEIIGAVFGSIFIGGLHFWLNSIVFSTLFRKSEAENKMLESIKERIKELD